MSTRTSTVRLRTKIGFWILLGMLSTALAEVISGSYIFPFITPVGWLLVVPVYLLHSVVGLWIIHRFGKPNIATLFLTGMLFGFYEFYLTKVLWVPPWGDSISVMGIDLVSFIILTMWFHPVFAFMGPLALAETAATSTRTIAAAMPQWLCRASRRTAAVLLIAVAAAQGSMGQGLVATLISTTTTVAAIALGIWLWRRSEDRKSLTLVSLVPNDRQAAGVIAALVGMYVLFGSIFRPEVNPALATHIATWVLYAAVIGLLLAALRRSKTEAPSVWFGPRSWWPPDSWKVALVYGLVVSATAALAAQAIGVVLIWGAGMVIGPYLTVKATRYSLGWRKASGRPMRIQSS